MSLPLYLPRRLLSNGIIYTEAKLLAAFRFVVILAEPGGGKTELMSSVANQLGTTSVTANKFSYVEAKQKKVPLVIDAFDELAKVDDSGIYKLLSKAEIVNPTHLYLSSRSSEWGSAATNAFSEFFGEPPLLVKLCEFNESEQRLIFDHHLDGEEDFAAFQAEVARFDLEMLLPNPQFLKLFADAYIESERHFPNKRSIFVQAVNHLAKEANPNVASINPILSTTKKVEIASEVFMKLLLSGSEGVCTNEAYENRMFPLLATLLNGDKAVAGIISTRLFKPGDSTDQHYPVHKIVAEYCSADYLTKRITDPADSLTLPKLLPIIAPNSTARDELRGLLGWLAALGNKPIQESLIELDPYAVLANGDPSQLEISSKRKLINQLKDIEEEDPYFRRGDSWRRFSIAGFFTPEVVKDIKPLLITEGDGHLRDLLLELLAGSPAIEHLSDVLRQIIITPNESNNTRLLAIRCLLDNERSYHRSDLEILISEGSYTSLNITAKIIENIGLESFGQALLADYFRVCATLYHSRQDRFERYFIKPFIAKLDLLTTEWLLDELTKNLVCTCSKKYYACSCRNGISKIVGLMLDRYFELAIPPHDPIQVWQWVENLNYRSIKFAERSKAVQVLQEDDSLRQGIIAHVFENLTDRDEVFETQLVKFGDHSHSGLIFRTDDYKFVVDLAFKADNPDLWASFIARHHYFHRSEDRGPNVLRRRMREQALEKPEFMREWAKANRATAQHPEEGWRRGRRKRNRKARRRRRQKATIRESNIKFVKDNRKLVESGRHWHCLRLFAELVLDSPDQIEQEFGNKKLVRNALRNCIEFVAPHVPDLIKLAKLRCASQYEHAETILFAACLEIMRVEGNLENVDIKLLQALRTNINMGYSAVSEEQKEALKNEVNRRIFSNDASVENFLRQYIETQLAQPECTNPQLWLLRSEDAFSQFRATLSIEWLKRFPDLTFEPLDTLFEIAAQYGNRGDLNKIIAERCEEFITNWPNPTDNEEIERKRIFWFIRAWYFLNDAPEICWNWLKADKETLLILNERSGRMNFSDHSYWPKLTSSKIEAILDAFIDKWPKVDLPSHFGTGSPKEEKAYRFLTEIIWSIDSDNPDNAIPVLVRLLADPRFAEHHKIMKSIHASQIRKKALRDFEPPTPVDIANLLDRGDVVTVEGLRQLVVNELQDLQKDINGGEFNTIDRFYEKDERLGEVKSTEIIAERLNLKLKPQGISVTPEHQLKGRRRSDFTAQKLIGGKRRLLVTEVKGQWHKDLYTAASTQLHVRYSNHPDAEQQGIFLALWFSGDEKVAGLKNHDIKSAQDLKSTIEEKLPKELIGFIDVFVLDLSRPT